MHPTRSLALFAAIALAPFASAQGGAVSTDCHQNALPYELTNFTRTLAVPKFDPTLGQLTGVELRVAGRARGAAHIESLDSGPTQVNTRFSVDFSVFQQNLPMIMFMVPIADFVDFLLPFDGTIDYGGTSGVTHDNIEVMDQVVAVVEPTPANLALFTGPGTIDFDTTAIAASFSSGSGNLIAQFDTSAAVDLNVCYTFVGNTPPSVNCPGPLMASVGVPISFQVCATDPDAGDQVTLNGVLPPNAVANPPFPVVGNPACTTITWTPGADQIGDIPFTFTANDISQTSSTCTTVVATAECHLVVGFGMGSSSVSLFGHLYDTQIARVRASWPVTMTDMPSFPWRSMPPALTVQVLMYNPLMFPQNDSQWSQPLTVYRHPDYSMTTQYGGHGNGITVTAEQFQQNGQTRIRFPFTIQGM